ncbi:hypothetical protein [Deinococcus actinosclerus]|uniref:Lipoprotein n=1 Tax=Deinococcus actinosclerus TaxID=1768108 RepID=A0ABM5X808_9DEIO|nr:hypothetical protein [Deinococcus actinosclerus]ALW89877.1 hypothetical protein AUC44_14080 [Deinococcus actinosclerus]
MKRTAVLLTVTTLLLAACTPTPTPVVEPDPATTVPAAPALGQSLDLKAAPATAEAAAQQFQTLTDPTNPDLDPDLKTLMGLFAPAGGPMSLSLDQPTKIGRQILDRVTGQAKLSSQSAVAARKYALPTGTTTFKADGTRTYSEAPTDGYVEIEERLGARIDVKWTVGGAATVWMDRGEDYDSQTGQMVPVQVELPTNASATISSKGAVRAGATFSMTPGGCLNTFGPEALTLSAWAGRQTNAPLSMTLDYGWGPQGLKLKAAAQHTTTRNAGSVSVDLSLNGTTAGRCTDTVTFTPTAATLKADLSLPGHKVASAVYLRDVKNVVISDAALKKANFFQNVSGTLNAALSYNDRNVLTASGSIADGTDLDLAPGDQVTVKYVRDGKLVGKTLPDALTDLGTLLPR